MEPSFLHLLPAGIVFLKKKAATTKELFLETVRSDQNAATD